MQTNLPSSSPADQYQTVHDVFNRPLHDLRISVIDRCNFRCTYCMPSEEYGEKHSFLKPDTWLRFEEIIRLTKLFIRLGVSKVRVTGGEPLLRPNLDQLIEKLAAIDGIEDLALTTNGSLLGAHARRLRQAGLKRLTVSLDALDNKIFKAMNGGKGEVAAVLKAIDTAAAAGFERIKVNAVIQRGVNETAILEMARYFKGSGHILRFIEYMDVGNCNHWESSGVVPSAEILKTIHSTFPLVACKQQYYGEVASRYRYADGTGEIGFISSVTQPFCTSCTRARLSTDGKIYTCLFAATGNDLCTPLREGATDDELLSIIRTTWQKRADKYSENRFLFQSLKEKPKKVEMYQIGG